jgi:hypothetical protein
MGFSLDWHPPGAQRQRTRMVVRMEPAESLNSTSRTREFELLQAFEGIVPVPRPCRRPQSLSARSPDGKLMTPPCGEWT